MKMTTTKRMSIMGIIALFLVNFGYMADMVIIPAANEIYNEFSAAPISLLNFILTGPQLIGIASALLVTVFMRHFSKKSIIVFLFFLFTIFSCLGAVVKNPYYIAAMRFGAGFAFGGLAPAAIALINEIYHEDVKKCSWLVGSFTGFTAIIGAIMSIIAGWLCAIRWDFVFYEYLAAIPMLILLIIFVPKTEPEKMQAAQEDKSGITEKIPTGSFVALISSLFLICVIFNIMAYQCSIYVAQTGLGDSMLAGILNGVLTIFTAIGCFSFAAIYDRLKRGIAALIYFFLAAGFWGCCFVFNQAWVIIFYALLGFGYGLAMPYFYMYATVIAPSSKASMILCLVAADIGLGAFLSSYFSTIIMGVFNFSELTSLLPIYVCLALIGGILSLILTIRSKKLTENKTPL
jgi:MFS family permease